MGTTAHVVGVGPGASSAWFDAVRSRLEQLEARWSRFLPVSDVCRANADLGVATAVAPETVDLVLAARAWEAGTGGLFAPAVLDALVTAGYDRTFEALGRGGALRAAPVGRMRVDVDVVASTITVHAPIDLGGIGKGAAADLVARELGAHVDGGCINLGGDLRAWGDAPDGASGWHVAIDVPDHADLVVSVVDGAIATSSIERRRWRTLDGATAHHIIDPRTGRPAASDLRAVTVVDGTAAAAEVLAKAALVVGSDGAADVLQGAPALLRTDQGTVHAVNGMEAYLS